MNFRARMLAFPTRTAHQVQAADDLDEIREILTTAAREALTELSDDELSADQRARIESAARGAENIEAAAAA